MGRRSVPVLIDIDVDGDLDLLLGRESGGALLYRNTGTRTNAVFVLDEEFHAPFDNFSAPAFGDLDGDGRLEALVGGVGGGLMFFRTGSPAR